MATFIPQSRKVEIKFGAASATEYKPRLSAPKSRAIIIVPIAEISVEATSPQSRWKLPLAETRAISAVLLISGCLSCRLDYKLSVVCVVAFIAFGIMTINKSHFSLGFLVLINLLKVKKWIF